MQSVSAPLNRLYDDAGWFVRAQELRLLSVRVSGDLRTSALNLLAGFEFHADNRAGWVILPDASLVADDGWQSRANRLARHWTDRRQAFAEAGISMAAADVGTTTGGIAGFSAVLGSVLAAVTDPLNGMVLVFAPTVLDDADRFAAEIASLAMSADLERARFVLVVDADAPFPARPFERLKNCCLVSTCVIDPNSQQADLAALLASAEPGALAFGAAAPKGVTPPQRVGAAPTVDVGVQHAGLLEAGIDPRYLEHAPLLRSSVFKAAVCIQQGWGLEALEHQRTAQQLCKGLEMPKLEAILSITLASYLSGLGHRDEAIVELEAASSSAARAQLPGSVAQAQLALGLIHALEQRRPEATAAYSRAGQAAESAGDTVMAIESWRLAGQLSLDSSDDDQASYAFQQALRVARATDPTTASSSSANEAARRLAGICRRYGLEAQAHSLEAQADRYERGAQSTDEE